MMKGIVFVVLATLLLVKDAKEPKIVCFADGASGLVVQDCMPSQELALR
jgi:hypothetical protein